MTPERNRPTPSAIMPVFFLALLMIYGPVVLGGEADTAWQIETPSSADASAPRILVYHDMEGLSGQDDPNSYFFSKPEYAQGQEMLAADINAVVAGLFEGGAGSVHIVDGHGSGNPEPDLRTDLLDPRAKQVFRQTRFDAYLDLTEADAYDAIAVVGMHAKTGSGGFASHTITLGMAVYFNGQSITETELIGLSWGRVGTPVIFASGDDRLAGDLRERMPWLEMVTVKTATGGGDANPRPVEEARTDLRRGAQRAVANLGNARSMRINTPVQTSLEAVPPASLRMLKGVPGVNYADGRVSFEAPDLATAYARLGALIGVATGGYMGHGLAAMAADGGPPVQQRFMDGVIQVWIEQESLPHNVADTAPATAAEESPERRWHGYQ